MSDYISREAAIVDFKRCNHENPVWTPQRVKTLVMRIPAADVEPMRHGRWIQPPWIYYGAKQYVCDQCKDDEYWRKRSLNYKEKYCPNCGSKMDLEGENGT